MYHVTQAAAEDLAQPQRKPMAILSGDSIYIVYPNGQVEAISRELVNCCATKIILETCLVWGDLSTL